MDINWMYELALEYSNYYIIPAYIGSVLFFGVSFYYIVNHFESHKEKTPKVLKLFLLIGGMSLAFFIQTNLIQYGIFDYDSQACFVGDKNDKLYEKNLNYGNKNIRRIKNKLKLLNKNKHLISNYDAFTLFYNKQLKKYLDFVEFYKNKQEVIKIMFLETKNQEPVAITNYDFDRDRFKSGMELEINKERGFLIGKDYKLKKIECSNFINSNLVKLDKKEKEMIQTVLLK